MSQSPLQSPSQPPQPSQQQEALAQHPRAQHPRARGRFAYEPRSRALTVLSIQQLSPTMRRMELGGDELEASLPWNTLAVADHVKVVPPGAEGVMRDFTIRRFDAARRVLTLDFALHGADPAAKNAELAHSEAGPVARWAASAQVGDSLRVLGPRGAKPYSPEFSRYVVLADETGLPATERWFEEAPHGVAVDVVVWVANGASVRELPAHPRATVTWISGEPMTALAERGIALVTAFDEDPHVWAAAEAGTVMPLRKHLKELGFGAHQVSVHGYWKQGVAGHKDKDDAAASDQGAPA